MRVQVIEENGALKFRVLKGGWWNVVYEATISDTEGNVDSEMVADLEWALSEIVRYNKKRKNK